MYEDLEEEEETLDEEMEVADLDGYDDDDMDQDI